MGRFYTYLRLAFTALFFAPIAMFSGGVAMLSAGVAHAQFDCTGVNPHQGEGIDLEFIANMSTNPTDVATAPGETGRVFVAHQGGLIAAVDVSVTPAVVSTFMNLSSLGHTLQGMTFHPNYATNGHFYVNYTQSDGDVLISQFTVSGDPNVGDISSEVEILNLPMPEWAHNGGQLAFSPFDEDGYLYFVTGDGGPQTGADLRGDGNNRAQDPQSLRGKLLRVDVDNPAGGKNYGIPPDNPFTATNDPADEVLDEIFAFGLRNPWRFSFDPLTGDLYVGDVGGEDAVPGGSREELSYVAADPVTGIVPGGANFQWRVMEGFKVNDPFDCYGQDVFCAASCTDCVDPTCTAVNCTPSCTAEEMIPCYGFGTPTPPFFDYTRDGGGSFLGTSVTGGVVYRGCAIPDLHGTYLFGDWGSHFLASLRIGDFIPQRDPPRVPTNLDEDNAIAVTFGSVIAFTADGQGEVYMVDYSPGSLYKIVPTGPMATAVPGDCNLDGVLDISDGACALGVLFTGVPPLFPCGDGSKTDPANILLMDWQPVGEGGGDLDISDAIALLHFLFLGTAAHPLAVPGLEVSQCVFIPGCPFSCQ